MRVHGDVCRGALILSQQQAQSSFLQASLDHVDATPNEKQSGQVHGVQKQMLESFNANSDEAQNVLPKKASGLWRIAGSKGIDVRRQVQFETKEEQQERRSRQSRTTSRNTRTPASTLTTDQFFCGEKVDRAVLRHIFEVGRLAKGPSDDLFVQGGVVSTPPVVCEQLVDRGETMCVSVCVSEGQLPTR